MFERPKTVLALDREAIETGEPLTTPLKTNLNWNLDRNDCLYADFKQKQQTYCATHASVYLRPLTQ
jgi:hypothetical protein